MSSEGGDVAALEARLADLERRVALLEGGGTHEEDPFGDRVDVWLTDPGWHPIRLIKLVRELTGIGLKEAKDIVSGTPAVLKEGVREDEAASIKAQVEELGATVELK